MNVGKLTRVPLREVPTRRLMTTRKERKQLEALNRVTSIHKVLQPDTLLALEDLHAARQAYVPGTSDPWELAFAIKTAVRALFSELEGTARTMCHAVAELGSALKLELSEKESLKLLEKRRSRDGNVIPARLDPLSLLKLAFRYYPRLFDAQFSLATNAPAWQELIVLKEIRDAFTHPKEFDDLTAVNGLERVGLCLAWFAQEMIRLLTQCERSGTAATSEPRAVPEIPTIEPLERVGPFFSAEDHELVKNLAYVSIGYFRTGVMALVKEVGRAMQPVSVRDLTSPQGQYAARNLVRTLESNLQGLLAYLKKYIEDAASRGDIELTDEARALLECDDLLEEKLPPVVDLWSQKFGTGLIVRRRGNEYVALKRTRALRDRIIHPHKTSQVTISLDQLSQIMDAVGWYTGLLEPLQFDLDRLPKSLEQS